MGTLWQDIRFGARMLAMTRGFRGIVVVIMGIGIGATTAMLSTVDATLFRPCPYKDPASLVLACETNPERTQRNMASLPNFYDWREQNRVFEHLVATCQRGFVVRNADRTERCNAASVSQDFFSVLGIEPILGRTFLPQEEQLGGERAVILGEGQWQRWFGGDPNAISETLTLDGNLYTVVGVLPDEFRLVFNREHCGLWVPMALEHVDEARRTSRGTYVIGRMKPNVDVIQAQAEMDVIANRLTRAHPEALADVEILVLPMNEAYRMAIGWMGSPRTLIVLLGIVGTVLLITCLHVGSLSMARSVARQRELAIRAALGAHRMRLMRQLLTENILLAVVGGLLGLLLAHWAIRMLAAVRDNLGTLVPWFIDPRLDGRSVFYALTISLATCALFGVLPAIWSSRINLNRFLSAGRMLERGSRFQRLRSGLVVADLAIAFILLIIAGLVINTYVRMLRFDPGINAKNVLTMDIELDTDTIPYSEPHRRSAFFQQVLERLAHLPGVQCAAVANATPAWPGHQVSIFRIEGQQSDRDRMILRRTVVSSDYFRVLKIPVLRGRYFTGHDTLTAATVAIINESLARRLWPDQNPIGKYIARVRGTSPPIPHEIVGVVADVRHYSKFSQTDIPEETKRKYIGSFPDDVVYVPGYNNALMVRTAGDPASLASVVRREIFTVDRNAAPYGIGVLDDEIGRLFSLQRFSTLSFGLFAAVAVLLGSMGIYGAVAYSVSRRTHEIGIRMALGARSGDVLKAVLRQGLGLTVIGLTIGLVTALGLTRVVAGLLHDVRPTDPLTIACASLILTGVSLLATYLPARRAAKIDPMVALRYE